MTPIKNLGRPKTGQTMRVRGGALVIVKSVGMRWTHIVEIESGKTGQVQNRDLLTVEEAVVPKPEGANSKASKAERPSMEELNEEFLKERV